jgi:hypothetical protein
VINPHPHPLPRAVRRRGLIVLLANTLLMWAGFFHDRANSVAALCGRIGLGGGLGNIIGSTLYGASIEATQPERPWLIIGAVGLSSAIGLAWLKRRQRPL